MRREEGRGHAGNKILRYLDDDVLIIGPFLRGIRFHQGVVSAPFPLCSVVLSDVRQNPFPRNDRKRRLMVFLPMLEN